MSHVGGFNNVNGCEIVTICDCDEAVIGKAMKAVEGKRGKAPQVRTGHSQGARRQGHRHRLDRHAEPLARAGRHLGDAGRQGCLRREAGQPQRQRRPDDRRGARKDKTICQAGTQSRSMPGHARGHGLHPRRQARQSQPRLRHLLQAPRQHRQGDRRTGRSPRRSITISGAGRPPSCR